MFRFFPRAQTASKNNRTDFRLIVKGGGICRHPFFMLSAEEEGNHSQPCAAMCGNSHRPVSRILSDRPARCHDQVDEIIIYLGPLLPPGSRGLPAR